MSAIETMKEPMRQVRVRALVLAGCLLAIASGMAHAAPATDEVPAVTVKYSDLNLTTDEGASRLYTRITGAARDVCPDSSPRELKAFADSKACQAAAIARAVHEVHSPRLAAVYSAHTNQG
jgi:UrcA family protein